MKRNKAFVPVREGPVISAVHDVLDQVFAELLVITNNPEQYQSLAATKVRDLIPDLGPLGGLYTALRVSSTDYIFVVACDMPFLHAGFICYMVDRCDEYDALIPRCRGGCEPLHAVYSRRSLDTIEQLIDSGDLGLQSLHPRLKTGYIEQEEIERFDPELKMFCNLNCEEDLRQIQSLLRGNDGAE